MLVIVCDEKRGSASPKRWPFQIKLFQEIGGHAGRLLSAHLRCCLQLASHRAPCCAVRDGMQAGTCHHERPDSCLFFSPGPLERFFLARRNRTHLRQVVVTPASCTAPSKETKSVALLVPSPDLWLHRRLESFLRAYSSPTAILSQSFCLAGVLSAVC